MKYCLSSRQQIAYLNQADEIKVQYKDRNIIYDFSQKYTTATFILETPLDTSVEINWKEIENYRTVTQDRLVLCLANLKDALECHNRDIPFYFGFAISSFYELQSLKSLGVRYVRLAPPLFFELDKVKNIGIPVRAVPNVAYDAYFPHENGICGQWIRPEDVEVYEPYIEVLEFEDADLPKERALFRIYHDAHEWPGELNMLFTNFNHPGLNRLMPDKDLALRRTNCGQRCQAGGSCRLCERYIWLAQPQVIEDLYEKAKSVEALS